MKTRASKRLWFFARLLFGVGLLLVLLRTIDISVAAQMLRQIRYEWILAAALLTALLRILMSLRWKIVLASQGISVPLGELVKITFISMFMGHFLPGGISVDILKGYHLASRKGKVADVTATLIVDRFVGVCSMVFVAFAGSVLARCFYDTVNLLWLLLGLQIFIILGWLIARLIIAKLKTASSEARRAKLWNKMLLILRSVTDLTRLRIILPRVLGISLVVQLLRCALYFCIYQALGSPARLLDCITFIPLVYCAVLLPITIGGVGVRELVLVYLFSATAITKEANISAGLLHHLLKLVVALPGLFFWISSRKRDTPSS